MRVLIRTSRWALRASRLGALALPLTVLPVLMHRAGMLESDTFLQIELIAGLIAVMALLCGLIALVRLWQTGDQGWAKALGGIAVALICLAPFGYGYYLYTRAPNATDVSTDPADPLPLISVPQRVAANGASDEELAAAYPNVQTRRYPLTSLQIFEVVDRMVEERGWDVRLRRVPPTVGNEGVINAIVTTMLGWRDEVVIRVRADEAGSRVDMRSTTLATGHNDLGANGRRIEEFLLALDNEVTTLLRDSSALSAPSDADSPQTPVPATRP